MDPEEQAWQQLAEYNPKLADNLHELQQTQKSNVPTSSETSTVTEKIHYDSGSMRQWCIKNYAKMCAQGEIEEMLRDPTRFG
jgi:hypothetical protein